MKIVNKEDNNVKPFIKWVGGKRQLLPELTKYVPEKFGTYFEPFIGGGAFFLYLQPEKAVINDFNSELAITWKIVRDNPKELLALLTKYSELNSKEFYLDLRIMDRNGELEQATDVERAARFIYMIKTGFNGMWRVNKNGQNNIPYGKYKNPLIADELTINAVSHFLNSSDVNVQNEDYKVVTSGAETGDFVYFDPPYIPVSDTSSFTSYSSEFGYKEQVELRDKFVELHNKGVHVLLSNSDVPLIDELYGDIEGVVIHRVTANRSVGASSKSRQKVGEVLVTNIEV